MKNYTITVNGNVYDVVVEEGTTKGAVSAPVAQRVAVPVAAPAPVATPAPVAAPVATPAPVQSATAMGTTKIEAGAAGKIFSIEVKPGDTVKAGSTVVVLEAMKMEIPVVAPVDGIVASVNVTVGSSVDAGALLATLN